MNWGYPIAVCGLGLTQVKPQQSAGVLQEANLVETTTPSQCKENFNPSKQICMISQPGKGQSGCKGDSGGPLFPLKRKNGGAVCLYGIVSSGSPRCDSYSTFTRVAGYLDWIKNNMKRNRRSNYLIF